MEKVFAVPSETLAHLPMGLNKVNETEILEYVTKNGNFYDRTKELEENTGLKQLVAYVIVTHKNKILLYQRAPKNFEKRLHGKFSIAFGGHVNSQDISANPVLAGRARELDEELQLTTNPNFTFVGILNIAKAPIDLFHLGFVYRAEVSVSEYKLNEPESFAWSGWSTPEEVAQKYELLESWSKEVFSTLYPQLMPAKI